MNYLLMIVLLVISILVFKYSSRVVINKRSAIPKLFLVLPSIMAIFIVFFTFTLEKPVDTKIVEYSAEYMKHYSNWTEKVDGKEVIHNDIYYLVYDDSGEEKEVEISKNTFTYFSGLWRNKEVTTHPQSKEWHKCVVRWNKDPKTALIYSKHVEYLNYLNNVLSIYGLHDIDISEAMKNQLFMKHSIRRTVNQDNVLEPRQNFVHGISVPDSIEREIGYTSSLDPMFRPLLLVWQTSVTDRTKLQESFWSRGKENEVVFCIGINDQDTITWAGSFSWDNSKEFENYILSKALKPGTKLDVEKYSEYLLDGYEKGYWKSIDLKSYRFVQLSIENLITLLSFISIIIINLVTIIRIYKKSE